MSDLIGVTGDSEKRWEIAIILCVIGFFGFAGIHRFYTGKILTGFLWLFTGGLFALGTIYDLVVMLNGTWRCDDERPLYRAN